MPLLVRIDLIPGGFLEGSHEIGRAIITNDGTNVDHPAAGNYSVLLTRAIGDQLKSRRGTAKNIKRDQGIWYFLQDLLEQVDLT